MGIFSSKYKTYVGTTVTRVIEDTALPNAIKVGALRSIVESDDQLIENVMEDLASSVGIKANMMYNYGRDKYMYGLPTASYQTPISGQQLIKQTIEEAYGPITIDYYHFGMLNTLHVGWNKLVQDYAYNSTSNMLAFNGAWVYLVDMVVVVKEATLDEMENGALDQWGTAPTGGATPARPANGDMAVHTPWEANPSIASDMVRVTYGWPNTSGLMQYASFDITIAGFDETASYHQVKFKKGDGTFTYWTYKANGGTYPAIDRLHTPEWQNGGTYFPWAYFRLNAKDISADMTTPEAKQMKKLTGYLNMHYEDVADAINQNPDIAQVENAFLMMGVPAVTTNQQELRYLFDYFETLYQISGGALGPSKQTATVAGMLTGFFDSSYNDATMVIQDQKFKMALGLRRIFKQRISGHIGDIGFLTTEHGKKSVVSKGADNKEMVSIVSFHIYRRQLTDSTYEEIEVQNLKMKYYVFQDYSVTADDDDDILLIPLDKNITDNYSVPDREELYARSLHYVFNSKVVQEIKWYQQGWFKGLMIVVAVVITVLSLGETYELIVAAAALGASAMAIAYILVMQIVRQLVMAYVIKLFVKVVGVKIAFIVALVAALYGGYTAVESGSVKGAPWASELLALSTGLGKSISQQLQVDYNDLLGEQSEFSNYVDSQKEKLDAAKTELGYDNHLAPMVIFGETPSEFYERTVHSGNIGAMTIESVTSYFDVALTLPKFNEILGESQYG